MTWHLDIENIGGIRSGRVTIEPGPNAVRASNWQGKSSLIGAVETALGTATPLTEGADRGRVALETPDGAVTVELTREGDAVVSRGEPYLADERDRLLAELFAFLDDDNPVRRAVRRHEDLEAVLTRPLDLERIDEQLADCTAERDRVQRELDRAEEAAQELPAAEESVTSLEATIEDLEATRDELAADVNATDGATTGELSDLRASRETLADRVAELESAIEKAESVLAARREELEAIEVPDDADVAADLAALREEAATVAQDLELLEDVYTANKRLLEEGGADLVDDVEHGLLDDTLACWLCGAAAGRDDVEDGLAAIADRIETLRSEAGAFDDRIAELEARRDTVRERTRRREDLEAEIDDLETRLRERRDSLETVEARLAEVNEEIEAVAAEADDATDRLTDVESELKYARAQLTDARDRLESLETRAEQREPLRAERAELADEIESLRTRKDRVRAETRAAFEAAMGDVIDALAPGFEAARLTPAFELVVARDGREARLDALSEGEVELIGIVAALAGYAAFDVAEQVPVILLDRVGGLAGDNLGSLVDYLADRTTYLVTTAYPEQGTVGGRLIDPAEWQVVSEPGRSEATS